MTAGIRLPIDFGTSRKSRPRKQPRAVNWEMSCSLLMVGPRKLCASIAPKVGRLLADVGERERIKQRARTVAEDRLAWPILTRQLEAFHRATLAKPAS